MKAEKTLIAAAMLMLLTGCQPRVKSLESNESAMTPNPPAAGKTIDPYTNGGIAGASGGGKPEASYATVKPSSAETQPVAPVKVPQKPARK